MSDIAIRVENLSKQYKIGPALRHDRLKDLLSYSLNGLFRRSRFSTMSSQRSTLNSPHADTIWALKDVSFELKQGETLGIIGRNGAGKSTLLKILSRITEPTAGRAEIHGRVGSLLEVGTGFDRELTGRENLYLNGAILGMKKAEITKKFDEIVAFAEVDRFIDTPVKHYSSGMYVRLAFAVAAHLEPEILIVDEVLAVGDGAFQKKCLGKMSDVSKAGRTVLFVSHNMQAINSLCSRGISLSAGKIEESGDVASVVKSYLASATGSVSERFAQVWDDIDTAPGNDKIRLHRISLIPIPHRPEQLLDIATGFTIEIEYRNLEPQTQLILNLFFYTIEGAPVFETVSVNDPNLHGRPLPQGLYRSICHIPGHFFNEGTFRMRLRFIILPGILLDIDEAAVFTAHDLAETAIAHWYGKYIGPLRPKLVWETMLVSDGD